MTNSEKELQNVNYETFILAISTLSILNVILSVLLRDQPSAGVMTIMNRWFSVLFVFDFLLRYFSAESKFTYFFKRFGWADLLSCLWTPVFRLFRLFRMQQVSKLLREYGGGRILRIFKRERANSVLGTVIFLIILVLELGGIAILRFENANPYGNIHTAENALWWGIVSIATVGYGDYYPVTPAGQVVGVVTIVMGVALFGAVNGFVANAFLRRRAAETGEADKLKDTKILSEPDDEPAAQLSTTDSNLDPQTVMAEIQRMAAAEDRNYASLDARLSRIEELLAQFNSK